MIGLSTAIASVGGTRDLVNRTVGKAGLDYTLIGWSDPSALAPGAPPQDGKSSLEGQGQEAGAGQRAVLERTPASLFRPVNATTGSSASDELVSLALSTPQGVWPQLNTNALIYLQRQLGRIAKVLSLNPRLDYWATETMSGGDWRALSDSVRSVGSVTPPTAAELAQGGFTLAQFTGSRDRLADEMGWGGERPGQPRRPEDAFAEVLADGSNGDRTNEAAGVLFNDVKANYPTTFDWDGLIQDAAEHARPVHRAGPRHRLRRDQGPPSLTRSCATWSP